MIFTRFALFLSLFRGWVFDPFFPVSGEPLWLRPFVFVQGLWVCGRLAWQGKDRP